MRNIKRTAVVGGTVAALIGGGVAFAYWTTSGTGDGSATTGTSSAFEVSTDGATGDPLTPGGPTDTVAFHITNHNSGVQRLRTVTVTVANPDGSPWTSVAGCSAGDYLIGTPQFTAGDVASGATVDGTVTIQMDNLNANQDGCKGATVPLHVSVG